MNTHHYHWLQRLRKYLKLKVAKYFLIDKQVVTVGTYLIFNYL